LPHAATARDFERPARSSVLAGVVAVHLGAAWLLLHSAVNRPAATHAPTTLELFVVPDTPPRPLPPAALPRPMRPERVVAKANPTVAPPAPVAGNEARVAPSPIAAPVADPAPAPETSPPRPVAVTAPSDFDIVTAPRFDAAYLANPAPPYPPLARRAGEQGRVLLRVLVTPDGLAEHVEVKAGSGSARLDEAARDAVRRWRFIPARRGADAVAAWVVVPIDFRLDG